MKINHVLVTNWSAPGGPWWDNIKQHSSEPLIEATIQMTLSWEEYQELLDKGRDVIT